MEKISIGKLKVKFGADFARKLEVMTNDMSVGRQGTAAFRTHVTTLQPEARPDVELEVCVLTQGSWPTPSEALSARLAPEMVRCVDIFTVYYSKLHSGRKLAWVHQLGSATVRGVLRRAASPVDLQVWLRVLCHWFSRFSYARRA